jgi:hypothetical protein
LSSYGFSQFKVVGDIGGGQGHLIRGILASNPGLKGILFDLPNVIQGSPSPPANLELQSGDFFKDKLPVCDVYVLMEVIHDWPDAESRAILQAVRRAAPPHAKLLLIEAAVPADPGPYWTKTMDVLMLNLLGGSQRTAKQYEKLYEEAGFRLNRVIDVGLTYSIFEGSAV